MGRKSVCGSRSGRGRADGKAELVNYRVRDRYYLVDRIFDAAELRLGLKKQQVVRIERVGSRERRRGQ